MPIPYVTGLLRLSIVAFLAIPKVGGTELIHSKLEGLSPDFRKVTMIAGTKFAEMKSKISNKIKAQKAKQE